MSRIVLVIAIISLNFVKGLFFIMWLTVLSVSNEQNCYSII
jgi:hypothetical protein